MGGVLGVGVGEAMAQDSTTNQTSALAGVALRYPEKTFYLGQVFKDTTNSYKLFWFLAILSLLKRGEDRSFRLRTSSLKWPLPLGIRSVSSGSRSADRTSFKT